MRKIDDAIKENPRHEITKEQIQLYIYCNKWVKDHLYLFDDVEWEKGGGYFGMGLYAVVGMLAQEMVDGKYTKFDMQLIEFVEDWLTKESYYFHHRYKGMFIEELVNFCFDIISGVHRDIQECE